MKLNLFERARLRFPPRRAWALALASASVTTTRLFDAVTLAEDCIHS